MTNEPAPSSGDEKDNSGQDDNTLHRDESSEPTDILVRRAEGNYWEAERFARSMLDSLSAHIAILDRSGAIIAVNRAWRQLGEANLPVGGEVCDGANYLESCEAVKDGDAATAQAFAAGIRRVLEGRQTEFSLEYACHSPTEQRWFVGRVTRLVGDGPLRFVVAHENMTERKRAEEEVRRSRDRTAQLEAFNKELDAFACSASHDLRAPLRAIAGFAQIMTTDHAQQLDPEGHRLLGVICSEARRMSRLIDDLLAFCRLGRQRMKRCEIDLESLAREVLAELAGPNPSRKVRFSMPAVARARGDTAMIRQALLNLLSNALKYTGTREIAEIEFGTRREDGETVFYVKDNGVGFDMKRADKLFGVFQRLHSQREFEGSGVGLALVERIIHRHGGRVWADARPNQGATFSFTLPHAGNEC